MTPPPPAIVCAFTYHRVPRLRYDLDAIRELNEFMAHIQWVAGAISWLIRQQNVGTASSGRWDGSTSRYWYSLLLTLVMTMNERWNANYTATCKELDYACLLDLWRLLWASTWWMFRKRSRYVPGYLNSASPTRCLSSLCPDFGGHSFSNAFPLASKSVCIILGLYYDNNMSLWLYYL